MYPQLNFIIQTFTRAVELEITKRATRISRKAHQYQKLTLNKVTKIKVGRK